jgi:outer membrane lipoprotein SlyB
VKGKEVNRMKRIVMTIVVVIFTLAIAAVGFAGETVKGTVTKVDGDTITVKAADGKELTGKGDGKSIKVGEKVYVHDGKVKKKRTAEDRH